MLMLGYFVTLWLSLVPTTLAFCGLCQCNVDFPEDWQWVGDIGLPTKCSKVLVSQQQGKIYWFVDCYYCLPDFSFDCYQIYDGSTYQSTGYVNCTILCDHMFLYVVGFGKTWQGCGVSATPTGRPLLPPTSYVPSSAGPPTPWDNPDKYPSSHPSQQGASADDGRAVIIAAGVVLAFLLVLVVCVVICRCRKCCRQTSHLPYTPLLDEVRSIN